MNRSIGKTVSKLIITAIAMFAFVFVVMVPLYDVLCDALGINGKTSGLRYEVVEAGVVDTSREVKVQFIAHNNADMPWTFRPSFPTLLVHPGAANQTSFYAYNPLSYTMVAQAIPSVMPAKAAAYIHKTACFCFDQQTLQAGEDTDMPLQFIIDQELPADIHTITLSYTLFDITDRVKDVAKN
jgi:cytochrome c oxidase assembly protein subunit 11